MKSRSWNTLWAGTALTLLASPALGQAVDHGREFIEAVKNEDGGKARELIASGGKVKIVDSRDADNATPLTIALARRDEDWTAFLLNAGADPNLPGRGGDTPLIVAARGGMVDPIGWLLGLGAKVNLANKSGETPLIAAVQARQVNAVRLLLKAGGDPDKADSAAGLSARDYAARDNRNRDIVKIIDSARPPGK